MTRQFLLLLSFLLPLTSLAQVPRSGGGTDQTIMDGGVALYKGVRSDIGTYQQNGKFGFVLAGQRQPAIYEQLISNDQGFIVKKDGLYGIADKQGKVIGKIEYEHIEREAYRTGNSYIVKKNGDFGAIDHLGRTILSTSYPKIFFSDFQNAHSFVWDKDSQLRMVINAGEKRYPGKVEFVALYANVAVLKIGGKFGLIKRGQTVVPFTYDSIYLASPEKTRANTVPSQSVQVKTMFSPQTFSRTLSHLVVQKSGKVGLVDTAGKFVYDVAYDQINTEANAFLSNRYIIEKDKLKGMYIAGVDRKIPLWNCNWSCYL